MIFVLSPSKGQDFQTPAPDDLHTIPLHLDQSEQLIALLRNYDPKALQNLMAISPDLAALNHERYRSFQRPFTPANAKQAIFAFSGDLYGQIPADHYNREDLEFAQNHMRILSGLYGCLRPLDLIQPYRLEMKTKLTNDRGESLYRFWGERITESLNQALAEEKEPVLINLASSEYFKAVLPKKLKGRLITIRFQEIKGGKARTIALYAKRARGMFADFLIKGRITQPEELKNFRKGEYRWSPDGSDAQTLLFTRNQP
jgi:cytoplasmic iron level regulating protein YaaA (DUF328/UPF0246 family)